VSAVTSLALTEDMLTRPAGRSLRLDPRLAPIQVVDLELGGQPKVRPAGYPSEEWTTKVSGEVLALVRMHGHPLGFVQATVEDPADTLRVLVAAARRDLGDAVDCHFAQDGNAPHLIRPECMRRRAGVMADPPTISVVIATRERPAQLARCLESVTRLRYPRYEVIVVDNDPSDDAAEQMVRMRFGSCVTYLREPRRGLAAAHNRGLAEACGRIIAFTDDDVIVDPDWLAAIAEGFAAHDDVGCVTGLIVPAELETPAQVMLEAHGRFAKGFSQRRYSLDPDHRTSHGGRCEARSLGDPLFPFTAGRFGSGANMAFSSALLRSLGGFDAATGAGSFARGGDDLLAFFRTIAAGRALVYQPSSIVWHHHGRTEEALERQAYGYGVGLGAYLAAAVAHEPQMLPALLRRIPRGIAYALQLSRPGDREDPASWTRALSSAQRRGLLYGPLAYARSRRHGRKVNPGP
jgi:GT2 family glycosyltransferase